MKIPFPFSGTGMGVENSIPDFRDGNWRPVFPGIPRNSRDREFPLMVDMDGFKRYLRIKKDGEQRKV